MSSSRLVGLALLVLLGAGAGLGLLTAVALEAGEVAVLRTEDASGQPRTTRVWVAEEGGALWLEAATPERAWYGDLQRDAGVHITYRGATSCALATALPGSEGHARVRRLLRAKYGWADRWVGLLQDTSRSVAVRLEPCDPERTGPW